LGTSLQIRPCRDLPRKTKKNGGKIVIINLQKTSLDSLADLIIHERCDHVMKYILEKLNLNFNEQSSPSNSIDISKYSHVKKIILLSGKAKSGKKFLATKLVENLPTLLLLHINDSLKNEDPTISCGMMIEKNDQLCLTHSIWVIDDIRHHSEIEFFKKLFDDRVLLVRIEASNDTQQKRGWDCQGDMNDSQLDTNVQWSFIFSNNDEDNFNEQMNNLMKLINS
jgi:hypothetical protein